MLRDLKKHLKQAKARIPAVPPTVWVFPEEPKLLEASHRNRVFTDGDGAPAILLLEPQVLDRIVASIPMRAPRTAATLAHDQLPPPPMMQQFMSMLQAMQLVAKPSATQHAGGRDGVTLSLPALLDKPSPPPPTPPPQNPKEKAPADLGLEEPDDPPEDAAPAQKATEEPERRKNPKPNIDEVAVILQAAHASRAGAKDMRASDQHTKR